MSKVCLHCYVSGKVQGVWFRANTQREASRLGLVGWVKNMPDGRVEVYACGEETKLEQLQEWLWQGPPLASVEWVEMETLSWEEYTDFIVV